MNEEQKYEVPKEGKGDVAHSIAKAALSAVPVVGGAAEELFALVITPPLQKRQVEWMNEVAEGLTGLDKKVKEFSIEKLRDNERFISAVMNASQAAVRNHQKEKRDALRNAVLNVAVGSGLTEDAEAIFLFLIDRYTAWHLRILRLFQNPLQLGGEKGMRPDDHYIGGSRAQFLETYYPDMHGQRQFYDVLVRDLHTDGMLGVPELQTMITGQGMFQKVTTEWGDRFVEFVTFPKK